MRHLVLVCALAVAACDETSETSQVSSGELEPLPTMEEARSEAAREIGPENADEELERLKREMAADR